MNDTKEARKQDLRQEMARRKSLRQSMLRMFVAEGELTTAQLIRHFGTGCSSRLHELRKEGHRIIAQYDAPGLYRYTYLGQVDSDDDSRVSVID